MHRAGAGCHFVALWCRPFTLGCACLSLPFPSWKCWQQLVLVTSLLMLPPLYRRANWRIGGQPAGEKARSCSCVTHQSAQLNSVHGSGPLPQLSADVDPRTQWQWLRYMGSCHRGRDLGCRSGLSMPVISGFLWSD